VSDSPGITELGIVRLRARISVPEPHPQPPHYECPNEDAFRHVANAYGDDNPFGCDPTCGVHAFYSGSFHEWWQPLRPSRRIFERNALALRFAEI